MCYNKLYRVDPIAEIIIDPTKCFIISSGKVVGKMPLKNRKLKAKHGAKNTKQFAGIKDIDIGRHPYCSTRLVSSLIGYSLGIITYIIIYYSLTSTTFVNDKLMDFCINNQMIFGMLFQPLITRKSLLLPPNIEINCSVQTLDTFYNGISIFCINCWCFHFIRRIIEVLFIHKYYTLTQYKSIISLSMYHIFLAIWISLSTNPYIYTIYFNINPQFKINKIGLTKLIKIGCMIFMIGEIGNSLHYYLLRKMKKTNIKSDVIVYGGLFEYITCPHYFFELISWFGFILISLTSIGSIVIFIISTLILSKKAVIKHNKYIEHFGDLYPKNKKAIIPFLL